jgi:hypothetical protein
MTAVDAPTTALEAVTFSLYRDIHKGIRKDLFSLVDQAGSVDPSSRCGRVDVADHLDRAVNLLTVHAHHEDSSVGPVLEREAPALAEEIEHDHERLDARLVDLQAMARDAVDATSTARREAMYGLYVELAAFTSAYLAHQDLEERVVMPTIEKAIGVEAVIGIHEQIIGNLTPELMAMSLSLMFPAMNIDDRAELLGGMRQGAPAEVFEGVWGLTGSVLTPPDFTALGNRLEIAA